MDFGWLTDQVLNLKNLLKLAVAGVIAPVEWAPQMRACRSEKESAEAVKYEAGRGRRCEVLSALACPRIR